MSADRIPELDRNSEQGSSVSLPTERGLEKLSTRVGETLKYTAAGFGLLFAVGLITLDIGLPLFVGIGQSLQTTGSLEIPTVVNTMLQIYREDPIQLVGAGTILGMGTGLNGALIMGLSRWQGLFIS